MPPCGGAQPIQKMKIIKQPTRKTITEYTREYSYASDKNSGYSFPCDSKGELLSGRTEELRKNYEKIKGSENIIDDGVHISTSYWWEPAVGKCDCGKELELHDPLDNFCACGQCYNSSAQRVAPSSECDEQGHPFDHDF
tara:strand:- start:174 stop:590 length:417 start_codon:yes stop_codon:yes gene_type:complete